MPTSMGSFAQTTGPSWLSVDRKAMRPMRTAGSRVKRRVDDQKLSTAPIAPARASGFMHQVQAGGVIDGITPTGYATSRADAGALNGGADTGCDGVWGGCLGRALAHAAYSETFACAA